MTSMDCSTPRRAAEGPYRPPNTGHLYMGLPKEATSPEWNYMQFKGGQPLHYDCNVNPATFSGKKNIPESMRQQIEHHHESS